MRFHSRSPWWRSQLARLVLVLAFVSLGSSAWSPRVQAQFPAGRARVTRQRPAPKESARERAAELTPTVDEANLPDTPAVRLVRARLDAARSERARASTFWPWFTLIAGGAITLGSGIASAANVLACPDKCGPINVALFALVGGAAVTTLGAIWVIDAERGIRELDSHQYHLEQELERVRLSRLSRDVLPTRTGSLVSLRFVL